MIWGTPASVRGPEPLSLPHICMLGSGGLYTSGEVWAPHSVSPCDLGSGGPWPFDSLSSFPGVPTLMWALCEDLRTGMLGSYQRLTSIDSKEEGWKHPLTQMEQFTCLRAVVSGRIHFQLGGLIKLRTSGFKKIWFCSDCCRLQTYIHYKVK